MQQKKRASTTHTYRSRRGHQQAPQRCARESDTRIQARYGARVCTPHLHSTVTAEPPLHLADHRSTRSAFSVRGVDVCGPLVVLGGADACPGNGLLGLQRREGAHPHTLRRRARAWRARECGRRHRGKRREAEVRGRGRVYGCLWCRLPRQVWLIRHGSVRRQLGRTAAVAGDRACIAIHVACMVHAYSLCHRCARAASVHGPAPSLRPRHRSR